MSVSSTNSITANDYNSLQDRISQVLGTGENDFGYGQPVFSSQVTALTDTTIPNGDSVLAEQFNLLRQDFNTVYTHQNGVSIPIQEFSVGDIVGADETGTDIDYQEDGSIVFVNQDAESGVNDFFNIIAELENNRFTIAPNQQEITPIATSIRTSSWNNSINTTFSVSFSSPENRRFFFNSGGQIRFDGTVTNVSTTRGNFWNDLIENPGELQFALNFTQSTGSTNGVSFPDGIIGNSDLTSSYQTVFRKDASSGIYSDSFWIIEAREDSDSAISFRITLVNDGPESDSDAGQVGSIAGGIQESVSADIEFELSTRRANGAVLAPNPTALITDSF